MIKYGAGLTGVGIDLAPTNAAIKAAQDLAASFAEVQEDVRSLGSDVAEQLDPVLSGMLAALSDLIEANKALEASEIVEWAKSIAAGLKTFARGRETGHRYSRAGRGLSRPDRTAVHIAPAHAAAQVVRMVEEWRAIFSAPQSSRHRCACG